MEKKSLLKATVVGGVIASAVTAGAILMRDEKNRKKVASTIDKAWKKVNTPEVRKTISKVVDTVKDTDETTEKLSKAV